MVFPPVPLYLDPPTWNQQQGVHEQQQHLQQQQAQPAVVLQPQPPRPDGVVAPTSGSIRPNSMADRARLAKIPQPEHALKCPRCDSTNTKFCYFNNYSLSQPRHFCKACRRYWTRGGALRNVPVGGGFRRNKRSNKGSNSSKAASTDRQAGASSSSTATSAGTSTAGLAASLAVPQLPFTASLHHMMDYNSVPPNLGLGFSGLQTFDPIEHYPQIQQFPFLGGLEHQLPTMGIYPNFDGAPTTGSELVTQMASVKMEDNNNNSISRGLDLARQYNLGVNSNISRNDPIWGGGYGGGEGSSTGGGGGGSGSSGGGGGWMTNLSGFNSSSTGSIL